MGLEVKTPPFKMSPYTVEDSDGNALLRAHAYEAVSAGSVHVYCLLGLGDKWIKGYVGVTNNPPGEGNPIQWQSQDTEGQGCYVSFSLDVAKGEYFEITTSADTPVINWKSYCTLKKPIDHN